MKKKQNSGKAPQNGVRAPRLKLRRVGIDTYRENVAYLHRDCALYRAEGFQALFPLSLFGRLVNIAIPRFPAEAPPPETAVPVDLAQYAGQQPHRLAIMPSP